VTTSKAFITRWESEGGNSKKKGRNGAGAKRTGNWGEADQGGAKKGRLLTNTCRLGKNRTEGKTVIMGPTEEAVKSHRRGRKKKGVVLETRSRRKESPSKSPSQKR